MKTSTSEEKHGIQSLLSRTHEQMQMKTASVAAVSASVGLSIHKGETKVLKFKAENNNTITLDGETLEDVESFTYLGSIIDEQGGSDAEQMEFETTTNQYQNHNLKYERQGSFTVRR
ncbi:unnamed protein product [Schistosoma margrebowiei]|uniref:Uncharacterized protein n=1 Tax=Schistosoma margrebowiei TaxID=48269 RepID=A0A183MSN8_9TREM|nr:unnamed protein product [Schistosoma margrebowiei]